MTVRLPPENLMRVPFELGWRPARSSNTPAFANSSLNFAIAPRIFSSGMTPASDFSLALIRIMNRICRPPLTRRTGSRRIDSPPPHSALRGYLFEDRRNGEEGVDDRWVEVRAA